jgi:hypothetical protein
MRPELPFLAAGGITIVGGVRQENAWPANGVKVVIATFVLVIIASASAGSALAPLVRAFGILLVLVAILGSVNREITSKKKGK